jgi:hypothetical protein
MNLTPLPRFCLTVRQLPSQLALLEKKYVFNDAEEVQGHHAHITIYNYEPVYEINLGALQ